MAGGYLVVSSVVCSFICLFVGHAVVAAVLIKGDLYSSVFPTIMK